MYFGIYKDMKKKRKENKTNKDKQKAKQNQQTNNFLIMAVFC